MDERERAATIAEIERKLRAMSPEKRRLVISLIEQLEGLREQPGKGGQTV